MSRLINMNTYFYKSSFLLTAGTEVVIISIPLGGTRLESRSGPAVLNKIFRTILSLSREIVYKKFERALPYPFLFNIKIFFCETLYRVSEASDIVGWPNSTVRLVGSDASRTEIDHQLTFSNTVITIFVTCFTLNNSAFWNYWVFGRCPSFSILKKH
jgi:hypothetical protein